MMKRPIFLKRFTGRSLLLLLLMLTSMAASAQEAYSVFTGGDRTLTFYYDELRSTRPGTTYDLNMGSSDPSWKEKYKNISKVVFDPSFAAARPTTTHGWFYYMYKLVSINGIEYLKTDSVTDMANMFYHCSALTSLDLSGFNTSSVTDMNGMFSACSALDSLDLSGFNTENVTNMVAMFCGCESLTSLDLSSFNTPNVTNMRGMFEDCFSLTSLDLSNFNTSSMTDISFMFSDCDKLEAIYVGKGWSTAAVSYSVKMFYNCTHLVGGQGTVYDENHVDATYAHIDGGPSNPGYLTEKVNALPGDVNGDGEVNIADVNCIINVILGGHDTYEGRADVNADGEVNIADINAVIACILTDL